MESIGSKKIKINQWAVLYLPDGVEAKEKARRQCLPTPAKFWTVEKIFLVEKFSSKNEKNVGLNLKISIWRKNMGKIKILSTCNFRCRKFATICQNSVRTLQCVVGKF